MLRKSVSLGLILVTLQSSSGIALAASKDHKDAQFRENVKRDILTLGVGSQALVKLRLRDGIQLAGYISAAGEESFTITDIKTNVATPFAYAQVATVRAYSLSKGAKISIGIAAGVALLWATIKLARAWGFA